MSDFRPDLHFRAGSRQHLRREQRLLACFSWYLCLRRQGSLCMRCTQQRNPHLLLSLSRSPSTWTICGLACSQMSNIDGPMSDFDHNEVPLNIWLQEYFDWRESMIWWCILIVLSYCPCFGIGVALLRKYVNHLKRPKPAFLLEDFARFSASSIPLNCALL